MCCTITSPNKLSLLLLLVLIWVSISVGVADFSWAILGKDAAQWQILFTSRIPRTSAIILTGATLAVAGMVLQIVLKNRFIEPSMIGAAQSAGLGVLMASLYWPASALLFKMSFAAGCALFSMAVFMLLMRRLPPHEQLMVPLIGMIFGSIIEAAATFIAYETDSLQMLAVWFTGDFSGVLAGRYELLWFTALLAVVVYALADRLTIAGLGRAISISLGINYQRMMWLTLIIVALITAVVVVTVGQIPFIGLVVPNIVSRIAGDRLRQNLPSVAMMGANLLLLCDILSRVLIAPFEIPVSTLFGVLGTAVFLFLLLRKTPLHAV